MSKCGYYSCFKGKQVCKHPTYGSDYTKAYNRELHKRCDWCRRSCGGIYPSEVPRADQSNWCQEVIDKDGNVIG